MAGKKKKTKICDKGSQEDRISHLPEPLISEILSHLSTKDAVRTSVLSTKWRNHWRWIPDLDLCSYSLFGFDEFVSYAEKFFDPHSESWIRKLRLFILYPFYGKSFLTRWINAVTKRKIQHLDVLYNGADEIPLSLYTCKTLVHLRLTDVALVSAEFVSLPCLKIMHLQYNRFPNETTLQKLISGSPVLEDLKIFSSSNDDDEANVLLQVRSHTLKRIHINEDTQVVVDAPLLQCLRAKVSSTKNFQIVSMGFSAKLDIHFAGGDGTTCSSSVIHDILTDISRFRELVISDDMWKEIFLYSKSGPVLQFCDLSCLNASLSKSHLEMLPTILESCPKLESFILELVKDRPMRGKKKKEQKVMFSTVPRCLVSSLKYVELKRSISGYEGEIEVTRYLLKNSTILEKLRLSVYYPKTAKCAFLEELVAMPRCSSVCEVRCSFITK